MLNFFLSITYILNVKMLFFEGLNKIEFSFRILFKGKTGKNIASSHDVKPLMINSSTFLLVKRDYFSQTLIYSNKMQSDNQKIKEKERKRKNIKLQPELL